jgi:hypothetical protein
LVYRIDGSAFAGIEPVDAMEQIGKRVFDDAEATREGPRGRDSLFLMARLRVDGIDEEMSVRVRNLSPGGLMAELPLPIAPESAVKVEVRGIGWVKGRVAWQTEGRAGIAFDREIDPQRARKPIGTPPAAPFGGAKPR